MFTTMTTLLDLTESNAEDEPGLEEWLEEVYFEEEKRQDFSHENMERLKSLLWTVLRLDPNSQCRSRRCSRTRLVSRYSGD